jgi:hypothetical protein
LPTYAAVWTGFPLAIELAAGHVHAFGARGLAELLGRFRLLMRGRRTAMQRHQTLGAALDWSYETLSESERTVLRRLSAFAGAFTLDDACAIGTDAAVSAHEVAEILENLVAKSLLQADLKTCPVAIACSKSRVPISRTSSLRAAKCTTSRAATPNTSGAAPDRLRPICAYSTEGGRRALCAAELRT